AVRRAVTGVGVSGFGRGRVQVWRIRRCVAREPHVRRACRIAARRRTRRPTGSGATANTGPPASRGTPPPPPPTPPPPPAPPPPRGAVPRGERPAPPAAAAPLRIGAVRPAGVAGARRLGLGAQVARDWRDRGQDEQKPARPAAGPLKKARHRP